MQYSQSQHLPSQSKSNSGVDMERRRDQLDLFLSYDLQTISLKFSGYQAAMISEKMLQFVLVLACLLLSSNPTLTCAQPFHNSTSKLPTTWINQPSVSVNDTGAVVHSLTPILLRENTDGTSFVCGFYCTSDAALDVSNSRDCTFGVLVSRVRRNNTFEDSFIQYPQLVWSANRNHLVQTNATLRLSEDGDLTLKNPDGTVVWSSDTGGKSVAGINLTEEGNLVLFGRNNDTVWQSFDYPTDSLLLGQKLVKGQKLIASVSSSNRSEGLFYISFDDQGLWAYINSDPPQSYFNDSFSSVNETYAEFTTGVFFHYTFSSAARFLTLGSDGHLKVFGPNANDWEEDSDLLSSEACVYPLVCGTYGICSNAQCSCLDTTGGQGNFFTQKNFRQPDLGCSPVTPISCDHMKDQTLLELNSTYYFAFHSSEPQIHVEDCKNRCLNTCSCKAAVFGTTVSNAHERVGYCLVLNEVFSIANNENHQVSGFNTILYLKVQHPHVKASRRRTVIIASSLSALFGVISVIICCFVVLRKLRKQRDADDEDFLEDIPGMPTRYSYDELKAATGDFSEKLGEGGFGSVYEAALSNGIKIAVKCLDGLENVKESFLVEVKAMGSVQHVNLVKLMGFCFEKSHRLLVYEYMAKRSLDGWIFDVQDSCHSLPWDTRKKIISDIAKGLAYLHEDCCQKIIHLDIKPQNILLDHNFNAKIGDFGLSKLIEKDQSRVVTRMRGTPGYLAPEWLSSVITEKVDVYSFGIVMLEIICGRRNLDWSKAEEDKHLLRVFKRKAEEEKLEELVDENSEDMANHVEEAVKMMGIAAWCLQGDFTKRPSMSVVVKVLEGLVEAETNLDYDFLNPTVATKSIAYDANTELPPSALSGPR